MIRPYRSSDREALVALWTSIFGVPRELVEGFYDLLPWMGSCAVAEEAGNILGMAHLIHGFTMMLPERDSIPCGYLYAVAVTEEARGRGLGAKLSSKAVELGKAQGAELFCTLPAEESLYSWYGEILDLNCRSIRSIFDADELPKGCFLIGADQYGFLREEALWGRPHVELYNAAMQFQEMLCTAYGGGMYRYENVIFCATHEDGIWRIPECIPVRQGPLPSGFRKSERPFLASDRPLPDGLVWNLTFD